MNRQQIEINNKVYFFKIGMRGIIYLQSLSDYALEDILVAGLITLQDIPIKEAKSLCAFMQDIDISMIDIPSLFSVDVRDLYSRAVGVLGISPDTFFQMSPDEVELAYDGYLQHQEFNANIILTALDKALSDDITLFQFVDIPEYKMGNTLEREMIFDKLEV